MALAPSLLLFSVPSTSIIDWSMSTWSRTDMPVISSAMISLMFTRAFSTPGRRTGRILVPHLQGLVGTGGCSGRDGGASHGAVLQDHLHLNGGVSAGVQDLPGQHIGDNRHLGKPPYLSEISTLACTRQARESTERLSTA